MSKLGRYLLVPVFGALMGAAAYAQEMTAVGTPRNETLVVQTFDGKTANPGQMNPLTGYARWRGFRELGWGALWEDDTATGKSYPELADGMPEVLNTEHTKFRVKIRPGVYWSDGVEFTTDDIIYTLDVSFKYKDKLTRVSTIVNYIKPDSWKKIDNYTFEVETQKPAYDFVTVMGVYTWGSAFVPVPKHVFEKQADVSTFENDPAVTLGPYKLKAYDPNGFWHLWQRRDDWKRSAWGNLGEPKPAYVLYKDFGAEETRTLAFVQNEYDEDTFMSPDSIQAAKVRNPHVQTFSNAMPYNDMNDACSYGLYINQQKAPFDKPEVRWALALSLNLQQIGISAVNGQFKAAALPLSDTPITNPLFYKPLLGILNDLTLSDGYKPFNPNFADDLVAKLKSQGMDPAQLPSGDDIKKGFGEGWWKYDPAEAEKLLASVGIKKGADGFYTMADGSPWTIELVFPSDWNKVMQRFGFSIADGWKKAGFNVSPRQVDNGEFNTVQSTNSKFTTMLNWANTCVYNANFLNSWRVFNPGNVKDVSSSEPLNGNWMRVTDKKIFDLIADATNRETTSPEFLVDGQKIAAEIVNGMQEINLMNIPTTIPTNNYYWTNYPKADNFYAAPYTWWSSFKKTIVNIEPTGK